MLNYNISLLKTVKEPLLQSFDELIEVLNDVMASNRSAKDLSSGPIVNIIGVMQMVGRTSLVQVAKDVRYSIEQLQKSDVMNWDHIRISEVSRATKDVVVEMLDQVRALERNEKKMAAGLWPVWAQMQRVMKKEDPQIEVLFDPDPNIVSDEFSPLDPLTLNTSAQPHLAKFESALQTFAKLQGPELSKDNWDDVLKQVESVFEWAYALKHRLGYHGYWLAARARVAYEILNFGNNSATQNDQLLQSLKSAQVELRKFVSDSRKPQPEPFQKMMQPLLHPWPMAWDAVYGVLTETKEVFNLEEFWSVSKNMRNQKSDQTAKIISNSNELLEATQAIKTAWGNLSTADEPDPRPFLRGLMTFLPKYEMFPNPGSKNLLEALKAVAHRFVSARRTDISSDFAQEVAVCLLIIEETITRKGNWPKDLEAQSELVKKRVQLAVNDASDQLHALPTVTWGVEKTRQQSQTAVSKVIKEVLVDLAYIEEVFDDFFRHDPQEARRNIDAVKNKMLTSLSILNALGQHNAVVVMEEINQYIGLLNRQNPQDYKKEYGTLSIALTGLTTFLSAFEKGDEDALRLLEPALKHIGVHQGKDKGLNEFESSLLNHHNTEEQDRGVSSVDPVADTESADTNAADHFVESVEDPTNSNDLNAFENNQDVQEETLENVGDEGMNNVLPSQDDMDRAQSLAQKHFDAHKSWTDKVVDEELAEAFFEEGVAVLAEIDQLRDRLNRSFDKNDLIDLRRQFHTLKGSGRTTQLWGCGEFGRRIETRLNEAISKDQSYTSSLDGLVEYAYNLFEVAFGELLNTEQFVFSEDIIIGLDNAVNNSYVSDGDSEHIAVESDSETEVSEEELDEVFAADWEAIASDASSESEIDSEISGELPTVSEASREDELVRLEQVHTEENTQSVEVDDQVIQVEVPHLQQTDTDHLAQQNVGNEGLSNDNENNEKVEQISDEADNADEDVELEAEVDALSENGSPETFNADVSNSLDEEQLDAALADLEAHSNNLIDILGSDTLDVGSFHWSAHTIAALARMLQQHRLHVFAKNVELVLEGAIDREDEDKPALVSEESEAKLRNAAEVLLDKSSQLLGEPDGGLTWNEWEEQVEDDIGNLRLQPVVAEEASQDEAEEDDLFKDIVNEYDLEAEAEAEAEADQPSSEIYGEQEEISDVADNSIVVKDEVEVETFESNTSVYADTIEVETVQENLDATEEQRRVWIGQVAEKMGVVAQQMSDIQLLLKKIAG